MQCETPVQNNNNIYKEDVRLVITLKTNYKKTYLVIRTAVSHSINQLGNHFTSKYFDYGKTNQFVFPNKFNLRNVICQ